MISGFMSRPAKVLLCASALTLVAAVVTACGTERITVPQSSPLHQGAVLFAQRCAGCHTLSYAATHGSATNVRTRELTNGPNFNIRCERPVTRVLYAIENGGFSGAIMPQNVVVGQDAINVAEFVATYAGRQAPKVPGVVQCQSIPVGSIPSPTATTSTTTTAKPTVSKKPAGKTGVKHPTARAPKRKK
jgi:mono/diheme cytochrome c family protein